eukprot:GHVN01056478.1.p1 GENE.GHVN01056478.1~~GHVN01056478.1.p1  ORF type:complete len:405 (-),score=178.39 GHVN01056478.1:160-1278(-)
MGDQQQLPDPATQERLPQPPQPPSQPNLTQSLSHPNLTQSLQSITHPPQSPHPPHFANVYPGQPQYQSDVADAGADLYAALASAQLQGYAPQQPQFHLTQPHPHFTQLQPHPHLTQPHVYSQPQLQSLYGFGRPPLLAGGSSASTGMSTYDGGAEVNGGVDGGAKVNGGVEGGAKVKGGVAGGADVSGSDCAASYAGYYGGGVVELSNSQRALLSQQYHSLNPHQNVNGSQQPQFGYTPQQLAAMGFDPSMGLDTSAGQYTGMAGYSPMMYPTNQYGQYDVYAGSIPYGYAYPSVAVGGGQIPVQDDEEKSFNQPPDVQGEGCRDAEDQQVNQHLSHLMAQGGGWAGQGGGALSKSGKGEQQVKRKKRKGCC